MAESQKAVDRPPLEEIANRAATAGAGLAAAAKAVALEDHRRMLRDYARRLRDSHEAQMRAAGIEPSATEDEDMGDISVSGDTYFAPPPSAQGNGSESGKKSAVLPVLLAALSSALGGAGLTAGVMSVLNRPQPQVVTPQFEDTDTDTQYELRLSGGDQKQ